jgi:hypothetical protein
VLAVHFQATRLPRWGIRQEGVDQGAYQLTGRVAEHLGQAAVGAKDPPVGADDQVGVGRVLIEVAVARLTFLEALLGAQALELGGRAGGEVAHDEQPARLRGHRPVVEDREEPQDAASVVVEGHGHVTVHTTLVQELAPGKALRHAGGEMRQAAAEDFASRCVGHVELPALHDMVVVPKGEDAAELGLFEFGDADVVDVDGLGQVADEGPEELLAGTAGGPLDHRPEGVQVVGHHGDGRPLTRAGRCLARSRKQRLHGSRFRGHAAPPGL